MKSTGKLIFDALASFIKKYKYILCIILTFIFIIVITSIDNGRISFDIRSNWNLTIIAVIFLFIIFIILYEIKVIRNEIKFEEKELILTGKLFRIILYQKTFAYDSVSKFIIGRHIDNFDPRGTIYSIYIDDDEKISKIYRLKTYAQCLKIAEEIINKTGKKIYDDTDNLYMQEEDLFRNYYKLKKTMEEVKKM